ncbi:hypothetical protein D083_1742 [Dickeya solani RNS 08.23.3.1.A]|nr:hypothetical protein D083_1742 [Dickeya solani RNS 08.23.3.1.A]AUH09799.1 hypothetical protein BJD21_15775 [Dickeya solani D s0432-1]AUH13759.1 hypothetical protein BJJ98_15745 [Dickeya solani]
MKFLHNAFHHDVFFIGLPLHDSDTFFYLSPTDEKSLCYIITIIRENIVTSLYAFSAVVRLGIAGVLLALLWGLISWAVTLA